MRERESKAKRVIRRNKKKGEEGKEMRSKEYLLQAPFELNGVEESCEGCLLARLATSRVRLKKPRKGDREKEGTTTRKELRATRTALALYRRVRWKENRRELTQLELRFLLFLITTFRFLSSFLYFFSLFFLLFSLNYLFTQLHRSIPTSDLPT